MTVVTECGRLVHTQGEVHLLRDWGTAAKPWPVTRLSLATSTFRRHNRTCLLLFIQFAVKYSVLYDIYKTTWIEEYMIQLREYICVTGLLGLYAMDKLIRNYCLLHEGCRKPKAYVWTSCSSRRNWCLVCEKCTQDNWNCLFRRHRQCCQVREQHPAVLSARLSATA
jgi:hypothetical protein